MTCKPAQPAVSGDIPAPALWYGGDAGRFLRALLSSPLRVAAIAPSGRSLARLMTQEITPVDGPVLELGPGTGVFTRALIARGIAEADLTLVELDADFATLLRERFAKARVISGSAADLAEFTPFPDRKAGVAISGLGLLSMPDEMVHAILAGTFGCRRPGGALYQFTYGPVCPVPRHVLDSLGLRGERIGGTWANLPPASVYRITRRDPVENHTHQKGQEQ